MAQPARREALSDANPPRDNRTNPQPLAQHPEATKAVFCHEAAKGIPDKAMVKEMGRVVHNRNSAGPHRHNPRPRPQHLHPRP